MAAGQKYTPHQIEYMKEMHKQGLTKKVIAERLGRSPGSIRATFRRMETRTTTYSASNSRRNYRIPVSAADTPDWVLEDRDRRRNEYRTPTQELMGDPPLSQSALGRRTHPSIEGTEER